MNEADQKRRRYAEREIVKSKKKNNENETIISFSKSMICSIYTRYNMYVAISRFGCRGGQKMKNDTAC